MLKIVPLPNLVRLAVKKITGLLFFVNFYGLGLISMLLACSLNIYMTSGDSDRGNALIYACYVYVIPWLFEGSW